MENYMAYVWVAVIALSIVAEAASVALVAIWFMPSAVVAMVLAICKVPMWIQIIVFLVLSALFILFSRTIFKKTLSIKPVATNADALIGESAIVTEQIANLESRGLVKLHGQVWSAKSADGRNIEKDEIVTVISIEGVKLICQRTQKSEEK